MKPRMQQVLIRVLRILLSLRYRIRVDGDDDRSLDGPTLVLPNHPAYIDPAIVLTRLRLPAPPRPLVFTETYRLRVLYPLMRAFGAVEVPDLRRCGREEAKQTRQLINAIVADIQRGDSFLIYPSGRLQRDDLEYIGTARAVHDILASCPDVNVLLVRTRGVWGSVFSCAPTGDVPDLKKVVLVGLPRLMGSLVLFLPRRRVDLTLRQADGRQLAQMARSDLNRWLESWYNEDGGEPPRYVPYHPFLKRSRRGMPRGAGRWSDSALATRGARIDPQSPGGNRADRSTNESPTS